MAISGDYPHPVTVNGFQCRNCSDVDRAKRNIDPANPAGGPFGMNGTKPGQATKFATEARDAQKLSDLARERAAGAVNPVAGAYAIASTPRSGSLVDVSA